PLHCGLRIPDLRARADSPLNRSCHQGVPEICLMRRLPAQRIRHCGLNATFRTRLQQCDGDWWPLSPRCYRVAHAARLGTDEKICDTVRLKASVESPATTVPPSCRPSVFGPHSRSCAGADPMLGEIGTTLPRALGTCISCTHDSPSLISIRAPTSRSL